MTDLTKIDCSCVNPSEAVLLAAHHAHMLGLRPVKIRTNYQSMMNIIMSARPRQEDFIEEESHCYFCFLTPTGRLLVYFDPECPKDGVGFVVCSNPDVEVEVIFAY